MPLFKWISLYLLLINILGFVTMGYDKWRARKNKWRVEEQRFFIIALMGGSVGVLLGMQHFRHKTKHKNFTWGIPGIIALQALLLIFLAVRMYGQASGI